MASKATGSKTKAGAAAPRERAAHLGPERRRPLVLDAALRLFVERGYGGTSMDAIADAAGVTKPVVYDCYPSKEALFRALLEREERRLLDGIRAAFPTELEFDQLEGLISEGFTAFLTGAAAAPDSWRVVFDSEHGGEPVIARRVRRARGAVVTQLVSLVEPFLLTSGVDDAARKAPVLAELLASLGEAGVRVLLDSNGGWEPDELGALLGRIIARGPAAA
jgi:AcrR family transcriptional regulator